MATASVTHSFVAATAAVSSEVNTNFTDLVTFLNNSVVHKDGAVSMTGLLTLHAADPSSSNHATRKSYVDGLFTSLAAASATTATLETRSSSSYGNLSGGATGPAVTLTTGTSVLVGLSCLAANVTVETDFMGFDVSGATTSSAADSRAVAEADNTGAGGFLSLARIFKMTVTAGSNTFTAKYKTQSGNIASFSNRDITVWRLN